MEFEVKPEPTEAERRAIAIALAETDRTLPPAYGSAWRVTAIRGELSEENDRDFEPRL